MVIKSVTMVMATKLQQQKYSNKTADRRKGCPTPPGQQQTGGKGVLPPQGSSGQAERVNPTAGQGTGLAVVPF